MFRKILLSVFVLAVLAAVPAMACNQLCRFSGGGDECVSVGWVTGTSCYMQGPSCIEVVELCWASKPEQEQEQAAWTKPTEEAACRTSPLPRE